MAHLVSSDEQLLLRFGRLLGMQPQWLQYKALKDPRTGQPVEAWHWDLRGDYLQKVAGLAGPRVKVGEAT